MKNPTLSICIATLNRGAFIGATLDSIVSQASDEVEVIIVDGASTDNTEQVVREYQQLFPGLRYHRLSKNGGVDQDYSKAVELASGEYCWLMTDDDLLKPGAIAAVLEATKDPYGLVIVNAEVRNADLTEILEERRQKVAVNRIYHPADSQELLADVGSYLSFIGCVVIKRQLWNARNKENYFGSEFVHVGVIFQAPLREDTLVIATPWIVIRYGNASWTSRLFEIWIFKWPHLIWSFSGYSESAKGRVCPREPWRKPRTLLLLRASGAFSTKEYFSWLKPRLASRREGLVARIIAWLPGYIVNFLAYRYFSFCQSRGLCHGTTLLDLRTSRFYYKTWLRNVAHKTGVLLKGF